MRDLMHLILILYLDVDVSGGKALTSMEANLLTIIVTGAAVGSSWSVGEGGLCGPTT